MGPLHAVHWIWERRMISIAAVSAVGGDERAASALERLAAHPSVQRVAVATTAKTPSGGRIRILRAEELRSAAGVVEGLRWFESTNLSHLLWLLSGRIDLSTIDIQRLAQTAADTQAA